MTDTDLAQTIQPTALAAMLQSLRTPQQLVAYRGALTPQALDVLEREIAALVSAAAVHDLGWLHRIAVRGEDRFRWLSGMVTNTVNDLFPNTGAWNLILNAQGQIQGDLTVWRGRDEPSPVRKKNAGRDPRDGQREPDPSVDPLLGTPFAGESGLELEIAADQFDKLLAHLNQYIVMDDVELAPLGIEAPGEAGAETAVGLTGPQADQVLARMGLPSFAHPMTGATVEWNGYDLRVTRVYGAIVPHYELWVPAAGLRLLWSGLRTAGALPVGAAALEALRVAEAIPVYGIDICERDLPQETSQMRALHFNKGCYLGQEIIERIRARGKLHRHLRPLELSGSVPAPGTDLTLEDGTAAGVPSDRSSSLGCAAGVPSDRSSSLGCVAGSITSAAALPLPSGTRIFALAMIRDEAEQSGQPFRYTDGSAHGTARILTAPPTLERMPTL